MTGAGEGAKAPRFPGAKLALDLFGPDGNALVVVSKARRVLRDEGATPAEIKEFETEAMAGDYGALLATVRRWVDFKEIRT
jgi:hypothetical protein